MDEQIRISENAPHLLHEVLYRQTIRVETHHRQPISQHLVVAVSGIRSIARGGRCVAVVV